MTQDFGLIETLLFAPDEGIVLEAAHLARLATSARHFGFRFEQSEVGAALENLTDGQNERLRLRLVLSPDGSLVAERFVLPAPPPGLVWRARIAAERFLSSEPMLAHKTTLRARYEAPLAAAGTDEVIFLNERGELCEGARSNLFIERDGKLLTPPLSSGLLPGTLRAQLLVEGRAIEQVLHAADLSNGTLFMGNSVRGLVKTTLI
jgi:branched-subunit amino acid aminotransferase/4-amino-4-deoxychorismate lyase